MTSRWGISFRSKLLIWMALMGLIPVMGIILGGWVFPRYVARDLDQELLAVGERGMAFLPARVEELSMTLLRQKALDVAVQLELYLAAHPRRTAAELQRDAEFRRLAVQPVGKNGHTLVVEAHRGEILIHAQEELEKQSVERIEAVHPGWKDIVERQLGGNYAWGYYKAMGESGGPRRRLVFFAPVKRVTADKVVLAVGATAAVEDINPWAGVVAAAMSNNINLCKTIVTTRLGHFRKLMLFLLVGLAGLGMMVSVYLGRRLARGLEALKTAARAMDEGHLDHRLPDLGRDEWGEVAERLNRMAARLQETMVSRREWENTFDAIPEMVFLVDQANRLTSLNRAAAEYLMMSPESVQGRTCEELARHLENPPPFFTKGDTWRAGERLEGEWHDPITGRVFHTTTHPLRAEDGSVGGAVYVARDITLLNQAQEELAQTSRFLHDVLEAAPLGIGVVDRRGYFTYLNPQVFKEFGYTPQELVGVHYSLLYATEEERQKIVAELREHGEVQSRRVLLRHKDGFSCPARLSVRKLLDQSGQVMGSVSLSRNIAVEESLQRQLEQAQRLETIATMAGGLAHNFNNLLMIIMGLTRLIQNQIEADHPLQVELKEIIGQVQAGSDLTRQLLALARETPFEVRPVDLHHVIRQATDVFARTHRDVQVKMELMEGLAPVEVDAGQIRQVLMNLLVNAWQAMPDGGEITIHTSLVTMAEGDRSPGRLAPGTYVRLMVQDTGIGMDEETLKHVFEPFFTTKGAGQGTGLGLATAYSIIRRHGGVIEVASQPGRGTVFTIFLPRSGQLPEVAEREERPLVYGHGTILLVDDEPVLRKVAAKLLERLGYQVLTAADGTQALEIYKQKGPSIDLVMLDVIMPGLNGYQTYNRLRALNPDVKVIFSSGYGEMAGDKNRPAASFIQKPYTVEALSQKLAAVLNSPRVEA